MAKDNTDTAKPSAPKTRQDSAQAKARKKLAAEQTADNHRGASVEAATRVRVYRHGLGDCILIRLRKRDGSHYKILIDCGVAVATRDAPAEIRKVMKDVLSETDGKIDVLAVTHQHWDHVSGFLDAADLFDQLGIGELWLAWTEDPADELASSLRKEHDAALKALGLCAQALGASPAASDILGVLGVTALGGKRTTSAALDKAKSLAKSPTKVRYWLPQHAPIELDDPEVRIFALGPPHDLKAIRKTLPSKGSGETFELALDGTGVFPREVAEVVCSRDEREQPFSALMTIPMDAARGMAFFQNHYWGTPGVTEEWRRIDGAWLGAADDLALALQSATNNTSLVLAVELSNQEVLLFAADAQVGNWRSWQDLSWKLKSGDITGPELLEKTVFYKVGHHGSFNATLQKNGLDLMKALRTAVIPVDHEVALKMKWGDMPLEHLIDALNKRASGRVFRTDVAASPVPDGVTMEDLYYEFAI